MGKGQKEMFEHQHNKLLGQRASGRSSQKLVLADEAQKLGFSTNEIERLKRLYETHLKEQKDDE